MKELNTALEERLCLSESFDLVRRVLQAASGSYYFYFVDGFAKDEIMEKMMEFLIDSDAQGEAMPQLQQELFPYVEVTLCGECGADCPAGPQRRDGGVSPA